MLTRAVGCFSILALPLIGCAGGSTSLSEADKRALRAGDEKFAQGVMAKNWVGLAGMYTSNASFLPPNEPTVKGRTAIEKWMSSFPPISAFTLNPEEVDGAGDLAYVRGTYSMRFTLPGAAAPIEDHGKYLEVLRKQADSTWQMTNDIFNSDVPLPTPGPGASRKARASK